MGPHRREEILALLRDKPLDFEPGSKWAYSNSNYEALGLVIEKVSGKKYGDLMRERILDPLGMKDTGVATDELILPKRAQGYMPGKESLVLASPFSIDTAWAAGSMYSTTGDLLKWEDGLFGGKLLSANSLKLMTTAGMGNYGFGVHVSEREGSKVIQHAGYLPGYCSSLRYAPERRIAVIALSNICPAAPGIMSHALLDVVLGTPMRVQNERKPALLAKEAIPKFVGTYELWEGLLTVAPKGDGLTAQLAPLQPQPVDLIYTGEKDGHPLFFMPAMNAEIEFLPDTNGRMTALTMHLGDQDIPGNRP